MQDLKTQSFINGEWVGSVNEIDVLNPATGESLAGFGNITRWSRPWLTIAANWRSNSEVYNGHIRSNGLTCKNLMGN